MGAKNAPGAGRPPRPNEQKRRIGRGPDRDAGGRVLPSEKDVATLEPMDDIPPIPPDFGEDGEILWNRLWSAAAVWMSPQIDIELAEQACRLTDDLAIARARFRTTSLPNDLKAVLDCHKALSSTLGQLGFSPAARTALGLAEVKARSKLEELRAKGSNAS